MKEKVAFEKGYRVSEDGNSVTYKGKNRTIRKCKKYYYFGIRIENNKRVDIKIHRLQAYQKYGDDIYNEGLVVRHLDGDSTNNTVGNIKLGTASQNQLDIPENIRLKSSLTATRTMQNSIRSLEKRQFIYLDIFKGLSYKEISLKHEVAKSSLSWMKNKSKEYKEYISSL